MTTPMPRSEASPEEPGQEQAGNEPEMCCDGKRTAEEHRHESTDGKCCIDK